MPNIKNEVNIFKTAMDIRIENICQNDRNVVPTVKNACLYFKNCNGCQHKLCPLEFKDNIYLSTFGLTPSQLIGTMSL